MNTLEGLKTLIISSGKAYLYPLFPKLAEDLSIHDVKFVKSNLPIGLKVNFIKDDRKKRYWNVLTDTSGKHLNNREHFNINVEKHVLNFDPSGVTIGCGCTACEMNHKVYLLNQELNEKVLLRQAITEINSLIDRGIEMNSILRIVDRKHGYDSRLEWIKNFIYNSFMRIEYDYDPNEQKKAIFKNENYETWRDRILDSIMGKEVYLSSELHVWKKSLKDLCTMCGIPIKLKKLSKLSKKVKFENALKKLNLFSFIDEERVASFMSMELEELIQLAKDLNIKDLKKDGRVERLLSINKALQSLQSVNQTGEYEELIYNFKEKLKRERLELKQFALAPEVLDKLGKDFQKLVELRSQKVENYNYNEVLIPLYNKEKMKLIDQLNEIYSIYCSELP